MLIEPLIKRAYAFVRKYCIHIQGSCNLLHYIYFIYITLEIFLSVLGKFVKTCIVIPFYNYVSILTYYSYVYKYIISYIYVIYSVAGAERRAAWFSIVNVTNGTTYYVWMYIRKQ